MIIGYTVILAFFWTPSSSKVINFFSLPVWCIFLLHLVSLTGPYRILFFALLVVCAIVGCATGVSEGQDQGKLRSKFYSLCVFQNWLVILKKFQVAIW